MVIDVQLQFFANSQWGGFQRSNGPRKSSNDVLFSRLKNGQQLLDLRIQGLFSFPPPPATAASTAVAAPFAPLHARIYVRSVKYSPYAMHRSDARWMDLDLTVAAHALRRDYSTAEPPFPDTD